MPNRVVEQFDVQISALETRLEAMRAIRNAIERDPEFVTVVQDILLNPASNGQPQPVRSTTAQQPDALNYERIVHHFLSSGNQWSSIREICNGTKMKRNAIANVLYTGGHRHLFEEKHTSEARVVWRVNRDAFELEGFPESCRPLWSTISFDDDAEEQPSKRTAKRKRKHVSTRRVPKPEIVETTAEVPDPTSAVVQEPPTTEAVEVPVKKAKPKSKYASSSQEQPVEAAS